MSPMQKKFCEYRVAGLTVKEAAKKAGYTDKTAGSHGYKLDKMADIQRYKQQLYEGLGIANGDDMALQSVAEHINEVSYTKSDDYLEDPLQFLERQMNNKIEDMKIRIDCAKALAPYKHQKKGETGKVATKQEEAEAKHKTSKFTPRIAG